MAANAGETKVKLWEGICYPENMRDDWQDEIDDILQVPFAYAVHDIDQVRGTVRCQRVVGSMQQCVTTGRRGLRSRRSKPTRSRIAELTRRPTE